MMPKDYLKYLTLKCKNFAKEHEVFDIVLYGSAAKGKEEPRDIDVMLIFSEGSLGKRLDLAQKLKVILEKEVINLDVKGMLLSEFFDKNLLARQNLLIEGYSLINETYLAEQLGFRGYALFTYGLKNLNQSEKTRFTYALIGRNSEGISSKLNSMPVGKGVIIIPVENSLIFEDFLKSWKIKYDKKMVIISEND